MTTATTNIHDLYKQLGDAMADILGHHDCPPVVYNALSSLMTDIDNETPSRARQIAQARGSLPDFLSALTEPPAQTERKQKAARS